MSQYKFPDDFQYIHYHETEASIQNKIDEYIEHLKNGDEEVESVSSGPVTVKKFGERYHITVYAGCWILRSDKL